MTLSPGIHFYLSKTKNRDISEYIPKPILYKYHFIRTNLSPEYHFCYDFFSNFLTITCFLCLHALTNPDFTNWLLPNDTIYSFSVKHNLQQSILVAHLITAAISHKILGVMFKFLKCQMYLDNSVLFLYLTFETLLERCFGNPKIKFLFLIFVIFNASTLDNLGSQILIFAMGKHSLICSCIRIIG